MKKVYSMLKIRLRLLSYKKILKDMLGVGPYLLLLGFIVEGMTIISRQWISFPIPLSPVTQAILTIPCVAAFSICIIWINRQINTIKVNLLNKQNELITSGPFAYVRHPLYSSLMITIPPLLVIWFANLLFFIPWIIIILISHFVVAIEERRLIIVFGEAYENYRRHVPALIPYKGAIGKRFIKNT